MIAVVLGVLVSVACRSRRRLRPGMTIPPAVRSRDQIVPECGQETGLAVRKNAYTLVSFGLNRIEPGPGPVRIALRQPPATAGITDTRDPAGTGVSSPLAKRTSSSPT